MYFHIGGWISKTYHKQDKSNTYAFVDRWLVGSCRTASSFSSSSLFLLEPGTERDGPSSNGNRDGRVPESGEVKSEPDRLLRLRTPGGEARLEVEYRFGREKIEGKPEVSRYSGGVVGSD